LYLIIILLRIILLVLSWDGAMEDKYVLQIGL